MSFKPRKTDPQPKLSKFIRMDVADWARIEKIAKDVGEHPSEVARQAVRYALENLTKLNLKPKSRAEDMPR